MPSIERPTHSASWLAHFPLNCLETTYFIKSTSILATTRPPMPAIGGVCQNKMTENKLWVFTFGHCSRPKEEFAKLCLNAASFLIPNKTSQLSYPCRKVDSYVAYHLVAYIVPMADIRVQAQGQKRDLKYWLSNLANLLHLSAWNISISLPVTL